MKYYINSGNSTELHITGRKLGEEIGMVQLIFQGEKISEAYYKFAGFETFFLRWMPNCDYELDVINLEISLAYRFSPDTVLDQGVEFMELKENIHIYNRDTLSNALIQKHRNQYHFSPYKNWMNDPNGLCWFHGYYHVFYQYNPNGQEWGNMHWGHAVSRDLLHWVHQPIVSYPQIELNGCEGYRGGAFSGSAVVDENKLKLFFTRHFGKSDRSWQRQWQVRKESCNGVDFSHEECCVWGTPEGVDWHFRDPKVIKLDGKWSMILAGSFWNRPAIFRYESENLKEWNYKGIIYQENDPLYGIAECPDFFFLDGIYVLIVSYIYADGRKNARDVVWYTGKWENDIFLPEKRGLVDIGKDFYAPQSFEYEGRRLCFGWNCCREAMHIKEPGGSNGSLSLPRILSVKNGCLYAEVIHEIKTLFYEFTGPGPYWIKLERQEFKERNPLMLVLAESNDSRLYFRENEGHVCLELENKELKKDNQYQEECLPFVWDYKLDEIIKTIEIYVDQALIEIYFNEGKEVCSRRFYIKNACLKPELYEKNKWKVEYRSVSSIW